MNQVLEAIEKRCSTRGYSNEKLSKEEIKALVVAGLQAPTARNEREIHISVIDGDNAILKELEDEKNKLFNVTVAPHNFYYEAPTVFIISADKSFSWSDVDAGIAVQSMALAAESMGLGSLIIGCVKDALLGEKEKYFAEKFEIPEGWEYKIAIAVGHKATTKIPHEIDLEKAVSYIK